MRRRQWTLRLSSNVILGMWCGWGVWRFGGEGGGTNGCTPTRPEQTFSPRSNNRSQTNTRSHLPSPTTIEHTFGDHPENSPFDLLNRTPTGR